MGRFALSGMICSCGMNIARGRGHEMMSAERETCGKGIFSSDHDGWKNLHSGKSGRTVLNDCMHQ